MDSSDYSADVFVGNMGSIHYVKRGRKRRFWRKYHRSQCFAKRNNEWYSYRFNGSFTLTVLGKDAVLSISFLGYLTQEITVGNQMHFNILLKEDTQKLDEVIVIGYGTAKKVI